MTDITHTASINQQHRYKRIFVRRLLSCLGANLLLLALYNPAYAQNTPEKIFIDADRMQANINTGYSTYSGHVRVKQGELLLTGDKMVIEQNNNEVETITVTGKPAHYQNLTEEGEKVTAVSEKMVYTASQNKLVLTINARLEHPEHQVSSQKIIYNTVTKIAIAGEKTDNGKADDNQRVRITLTPKTSSGPE